MAEVAFSIYRGSLHGSFWCNPGCYPDGVFVVVILDVTNLGEFQDASPGPGLSIKDSSDEIFNPIGGQAQFLIREEYGVSSYWDDIPPGATGTIGLVYDVPLQAQGMYLVPRYGWGP